MPMPEKMILTAVKGLVHNALPILKDEAYQRRVWFKLEGTEVSSYIDTTVYFLNECNLIFKHPIAIDFLGKENYEPLKKLYELVLTHVDLTEERIDPDFLKEEELLNDPNWHDIQTLASEVEVKLTDFIRMHHHE